VIGTNKRDAKETVERFLEDLNTHPFPQLEGAELSALLRSKQIRFTSSEDWNKQNLEEVARGKSLGKPRDKITSFS